METLVRKKKGWTCDEQVVECGAVGPALVRVSFVVAVFVKALADRMGNDEFVVYLLGEIVDEEGGTTYWVDSAWVPPQEVGPASVEVKAGVKTPRDFIGILHSHHGMGTFFSDTDEEYANGNCPLSVVVAQKGDGMDLFGLKWKANAKRKTLCGKVTHSEAEVELWVDFEELPAYLEEAMKNIERRTYTATGVGFRREVIEYLPQEEAGEGMKCPACGGQACQEYGFWWCEDCGWYDCDD